MVENWNSANVDFFYGKSGDLTGPDREHAEVSALSLHLIQAALAYVNTIMIQIVLRDPAWRDRLTDEDRRGLSALFWTHVNLYLDTLQNCYGAWTSGFPGRPGPEGWLLAVIGTCQPTAIRNCPEMVSSVTDCY